MPVHIHLHRRRSQQPRLHRAQVVSGVGFLGAGMILKSDNNTVRNLTTAAIWFAAAIGMAIGIGRYAIAMIASVYAVIVPRIPPSKGGSTASTTSKSCPIRPVRRIVAENAPLPVCGPRGRGSWRFQASVWA